MRGKYAAKADNRRDRAEAEHERNQATLRAERAEKALREAEARHTREREAYVREIAMLRLAAEESIAPVVEEQARRLEVLRGERDVAKAKLDAWLSARRKLERALAVTISENFAVALNESKRLINEVWAWCIEVDSPDVITPDEVYDVDTNRGSSRLILQAVTKGRLKPEQGDAIVAIHNGQPFAERHGDESPWGRMWVSESKLSAAFAAGDD